jgi:hypothetical protein
MHGCAYSIALVVWLMPFYYCILAALALEDGIDNGVNSN